MGTILDTIIASKRREVAAAKQRVAELSARFPTRDWRIKMDGKVLDNED